jgi:hypothetical protein
MISLLYTKPIWHFLCYAGWTFIPSVVRDRGAAGSDYLEMPQYIQIVTFTALCCFMSASEDGRYSRKDNTLTWKHSPYKGKAVPLHAMEALGGRGGIAPTHARPRHSMWVSGQRHAPAALYPPGKDRRYPLDRRLGWPQSRSGRRG